MKIIKTDIYDINEKNIDEHKVSIADNILNLVGPMFESEIEEANRDTEKTQRSKNKIDEQLQETKEKLEAIQIEFNRETKRKKLLNRIRQLIEVNLTQDPSLKSEVIILLKVIDKLEDNLLDEHIERMIRTLSKRFSKKL